MKPAEEKRTFSASRIVRWVGTVFSTTLFVYLLSLVDWRLILQSLTQLPVWLLLTVYLCYVMGMVANGLRWYVLLYAQQVKVSFLEVLKMVFTGAFISNFLPSTVGGDIARIAASYRYTKSASLSGASVLLERLINMASMLSAAPFLLTLARPGTGFENFLSLKPLASVFILDGLFQKIYAWIEKHWSNEISNLKLALKIWLKKPFTLVLAFGIAWGSNLIVFLGMWLLATRIGMHITFLQVIGVNFFIYFLTLLPISINGFGVKELSEISIYVFLGATLEQATIFTILTRFIALSETFPGALWVSQAFTFSKMNENLDTGLISGESEKGS
jgi:glycosyltransferase 2 family protein